MAEPIIIQYGVKIMKLGIKDSKIYDICSSLESKRDDSIDDKDYLDLPMEDWVVGDTWDFDNNISLKDSPLRFIEPQKSELELKIEELELRLEIIENKELAK